MNEIPPERERARERLEEDESDERVVIYRGEVNGGQGRRRGRGME